MAHITVSGTSVSDRLTCVFDNIKWACTKVILVGGILVSVPGVITGTIVPAEGMSRTDTFVKNVVHDHAVVWEHIGGGLNNLGAFLESEG